MAALYVPMRTTDDWQNLLAEPTKHWKEGRSAMSMALSCMGAKGFPASVQHTLRKSDSPHLREAEFVVGFPERKVGLPGGAAASQTDLMVVARTSRASLIIAVEGKVDEPFGELVKDWKTDASPGKKERLNFLCAKLGLNSGGLDDCRYQLLHRTASAIIEAERFHAKDALMLVHSFDTRETGFDDYERFVSLFDIRAEVGRTHCARAIAGIDLHFGWTSERLAS